VKRVVVIICTCLCMLMYARFLLNAQVDVAEDEEERDAIVSQPEVNEETPGSSNEVRKVNIDMQAVYGAQYNNMFSTIKRSDDYGYKDTTYDNSSYYENRISFTGNYNATEIWKIIFEGGVDSDSRGMFDNEVYSREEKEKSSIALQNIIKVSPQFETYLRVGVDGYTHRLAERESNDNVKSDLYHVNGEFGGEYIWSSSNRLRTKVFGARYIYSEEDVESDRYWKAELIEDFNVTNYVGISLGVNYNWNNDEDSLAYEWEKYNFEIPIFPLAEISLKGVKYFSMSVAYRYDLKPFRPEISYFEQNYIYPIYDLPPSKLHHGECKMDLHIDKVFNLKVLLTAEKYNNYFNYIPANGQLLTAHTVPATNYSATIDGTINLLKNRINFIAGYTYAYYDADENITYKPTHSFAGTVKYNGKKWKLEWTNNVLGKVFVDPEDERILDRSVVGVIGIQREIVNSFYAYLRVENAYNNKYYLREGYPEAGIMWLLGLRILI
jgi:hypothetical protein